MTLKRAALIAAVVLLWLVTLLEAFSMVNAGWAKYKSFDGWWHWFQVFGFPGWFAPVIGGLEMLGAVLLVVPRIASYAAIMLIGIMMVALYSVLTSPTDLGAFGPLIHMAFLSVILMGWWRKRWRVAVGAGNRRPLTSS